MPIQFLAMRDPVSTEALFSDGSSGEYEASARKRRSAETHNKNPSSSFSRRLFVGLKTRSTTFIVGTERVGQTLLPANREPTLPHPKRSTPEPHDYHRNQSSGQLRTLGQYAMRKFHRAFSGGRHSLCYTMRP